MSLRLGINMKRQAAPRFKSKSVRTLASVLASRDIHATQKDAETSKMAQQKKAKEERVASKQRSFQEQTPGEFEFRPERTSTDKP
jgi:hypothetical protein